MKILDRLHLFWGAALLAAIAPPALAATPAPQLLQLGLRDAEVAADVEPPSQSSQMAQMLREAQALYARGRYVEAAATWQQAADSFAAQSSPTNQAMVLSNLSLVYQELGEWERARSASDRALEVLPVSESPDSQRVLGQTLNTRGKLLLRTGDPEQALEVWERSASAYEASGYDPGFYQARINQSQALQALGMYRRALHVLEEVKASLEAEPDSVVKASALAGAGNALRLIGDMTAATEALQSSLEVAQRLNSPDLESTAWFGLGNTYRANSEVDRAIEAYNNAVATATTHLMRVQARLNAFSLLAGSDRATEALAMVPDIETDLAGLTPSRPSVYARVNFGNTLAKMNAKGQTAAESLAKAVQEAKAIGDRRATSYALGNLGHLYELNQRWIDAQELTQDALLISQAINAADISYQWQWQLGRVLKSKGDYEPAIAAYSESVKSLQSLRQDLVAVNPDVQFSFRESVEPVYREMVGLLVRPPVGKPSQANLSKAREAIEALQLAELDNFFRDTCLDANPLQIDEIDRSAAVFYPIILEDALEVVISYPDGTMGYHAAEVDRATVEETVTQLRQTLVTRTTRSYLPLSQQLYDWILRPAEADIASRNTETLVFVLDGPMRNIPMAALNDGEKYLLEKYAIALTPGLQLLPSNPLERGELTALTAGLTKARQGFSALPNVEVELTEISSNVTGDKIVDDRFTLETLQKYITGSSYPIVHIATHGQFSSKAEDTFILTWDDRLSITQLEGLLRSSEEGYGDSAIELLVLSACQTAAGDKRAALGLAGVAVRAGARSTIASLWYIDDAATAPLMSQFYQELKDPSVTKGEALRRAQVKLLETGRYRHPIYWSPYVLVGNWQ